MKKIILAVAALFIAFLVSCSNDYGSGSAVNAGEGPIVLPSTHNAADFEEPEIESSSSEENAESSSSAEEESGEESSSSEESSESSSSSESK